MDWNVADETGDLLCAVLLAGGKSNRFGEDKASIVLDGETLVQRHLRQFILVGGSEAVIVCNDNNYSSLCRSISGRSTAKVRVTCQEGPDMTAAVKEGIACLSLRRCSLFIVCVNDIITDESYRRIAAPICNDYNLRIPTYEIRTEFVGGRLIFNNDTTRVVRIEERPQCGCKLGDYANIMIHHYSSEGLASLHAVLDCSQEYESGLSAALACGSLKAQPLIVDCWAPIKRRADLSLAASIFAGRKG